MLDDSSLQNLWATMDAEKGDLVSRTENYARLTLPYICAPDGSNTTEQDKGDVAIGPRLINHLANKVVATMFPHDKPFFTISLTPKAKRNLLEQLGEGQEANLAEHVRTSTSGVEQEGIRKMNLVAYRPQAIEAVKHMQISGNALIRRLENGKRVVYGIRDFCIRRDLDGAPNEMLLKDAKKFNGLPEALKQRVRQKYPTIKDDQNCVLLSHYKRVGARWHFRQAVDDVIIDNAVRFKPVDLPVLPLTWTLERGAHYARGQVEENIIAFHNIDVCSKALVDKIGILCDTKFLVDPSSVIDIVDYMNSARGSVHSGRKDDITTPEAAANMKVGELDAIIQRWERELGQAFLLSSAVTRDAERVTAEEIRFQAAELESAFGGLYSRLSIEWQQLEAEFAISQIDFADIGSAVSMFEIIVTTGLESLSRAGALNNLRMAIQDLAMLEGVPDDIRASINPLKFASFVMTNHTVDLKEFMYTQDEMQANKDAEMKQQEQLAGVQANANVQQKAGEKAVAES